MTELDAKALEAAKAEAKTWGHAVGGPALPAILRAYLQALPPQSPLGATGWKMVPVEPTPEMLEQGYDAYAALAGHGVPVMMDNAYRAMLTAAPDRPGADRAGWQPIETAPKDGTRVLLAAPGHLTMIGSFEAWKTIHAAGPWWWSNGSTITPEPTHWQPLPASPKESR